MQALILPDVPVIVVGADTPLGPPILDALGGRDGEIRVFVSDPRAAETLRESNLKVAVGDVSDASHIGGAALGCFGAVLLTDATTDSRERAFLPDPETVIDAWDAAISAAGVQRAIWIGSGPTAPSTPEAVTVRHAGRSPTEVAAEVAELDDLREL